MSEKFHCPHCGKSIAQRLIDRHKARLAGQATSDAKAEAARENGKKGGRPRGSGKKGTP